MFALALAVRIAYLIHIRENASFQIIALDSELFDQKALEILSGDVWGHEIFYSAPLYPYFLAMIYALFGPTFLAVRIVQVVLGSLTAVLVVRLGEEMFDEPVPLIAGLITALYGPFIFFNATLLGTTLAAFLATWSVLMFAVSRDSRRRDVWILLAGVSVGFTSLARPNTVIVLPLWILCLALLHRRERWIRSSLILLVGGGLVIAPVTVRNAVVGRDFVPISSHGGINFWIGNHPHALGTFDLPPGIRGTPEQVNLIDSSRLANQAAGRSLSPSEVSAYWFRRGLEYIRDNPGEYAGLLGRKVHMFWNRVEIPLNVNFHFLQRSSPLLRIPLMHFGLISPLAILGMGLSVRRWRRAAPAASFVLVYFLSAVVFFVSGRYRIPATPILIVFASYAGAWIYRRVRERKWKPALVTSVALIPLVILAYVPVADFDVERSFGRDFYYLAAESQSEGRIQTALEYYQKSIEHNPEFWMSYNGRGVCLADMGQLAEAVASFETAIRLAPTRAEPWTNLGIALATHGRVAEAVSKWERALELDPYDESAKTNLAKARAMLDRSDQ